MFELLDIVSGVGKIVKFAERFKSGDARERGRCKNDARALAALVDLVLPVSDRNKWMAFAETLGPYSVATSTFARLDACFRAADVLRDAHPDCLKTAARSGNLEI